MKDKCEICFTKNFEEVFFFDKTVFSDGSVKFEPLVKKECRNCGAIKTNIKEDLKKFYKYDYKPSRNIDSLILNNKGEITRSEFVFKWIKNLIPDITSTRYNSILEIGCGQGYLLDRFNITNKFGVEPSSDAFKKIPRNINARNISYEDINPDEKYDLVVSYCVIEHLEKPTDFLHKVYHILPENGVMCIALPIQDKFNYDLFFADHLHHFSHDNFLSFLNNHGFNTINHEIGNGAYSNIGIYVCNKKQLVQNQYFFHKNKNIVNCKIILRNINDIIKSYKANVYAFGYGEIARTIIPYTNLDDSIINYIDDYSSGKKVISSLKAKEIFKKNKKINLIILVNHVHTHAIKELFKEFKNINFINIFENIELD